MNSPMMPGQKTIGKKAATVVTVAGMGVAVGAGLGVEVGVRLAAVVGEGVGVDGRGVEVGVLVGVEVGLGVEVAVGVSVGMGVSKRTSLTRVGVDFISDWLKGLAQARMGRSRRVTMMYFGFTKFSWNLYFGICHGLIENI